MSKALHLIAGISLAANALCFTFWWQQTFKAGNPTATLATPSTTQPLSSTHLPANSVSHAPLWQMSATKRDYDGFIARLRSVGCPPGEIAALMVAILQQASGETYFALRADEPYWSSHSSTEDPSVRALLKNENREQLKLWDQYVLGPEFFPYNEALQSDLRNYFGDFPTEKLRQIALLKNLQSMRQEDAGDRLPAQPGTDRDAAYAAQHAEIEKAHWAALRALLTPAEYEAYELRNSSLAEEQRGRLSTFQPTEEEYKIVFQFEKALREARSDPNLSTEQKQAMRDATDAAVAAQLDPARGADYTALRKNLGNGLPDLMVRLKLPLSTITTVNSLRDEVTATAKGIRTDTSLTQAERTARLSELYAGTRSRLTNVFGPTGFESYVELKGEWLSPTESITPGKP